MIGPAPIVVATSLGVIVETCDTFAESAGAWFSLDRLHRFRLWREWNRDLPRVAFAMLNPSTADAFKLDPTVRRCLGFARAWGYGRLDVINLYSLRSTDPKGLLGGDPTRYQNEVAWRGVVGWADLIVAAWGASTPASISRSALAVRAILSEAAGRIVCLGRTAGGHPRHPLYVPAATLPEVFA